MTTYTPPADYQGLSLHTLCIRHRIFGLPDNPTPDQILPQLQLRLDQHRRNHPRCSIHSADYAEWKQILDSLEEFHTHILTLVRGRQTQELEAQKQKLEASNQTSNTVRSSAFAPKLSPMPNEKCSMLDAQSPPHESHSSHQSHSHSPHASPSSPQKPSYLPTPPKTTPKPPSHLQPPPPKPVSPPPRVVSPQLPQPQHRPISSHFFHIKHRPDAKLLNLPEPDQQTIIDWLDSGLSLAEVAEKISKPREQGGLNINTSKQAVHRFQLKHQLAERIHAAADSIALSQMYVVPPLGGSPAEISNLKSEIPDAPADPSQISPQKSKMPFDLAAPLQTLLHAQALQVATGDFCPTNFRLLTQFLKHIQQNHLRHRALDLHHKRLSFHMQTFQYKTFKRFIAEFPKIKKHLENQKLSPEERVHAAWAEAFGIQANDTIDEGNDNYRQNFPDADPANNEPPFDANELVDTESAQEHYSQGVSFFQQAIGLGENLNEKQRADAALFREKLLQQQQRALAQSAALEPNQGEGEAPAEP